MSSLLIVEDEVYLSRFIELELTHAGYRVTVANDGAEGFRLAQETPFDLILLDLMLPGMNGFDFCKAFRAFSQTPIIMLTAKDEISDKIDGLDLGANDYITKPFAIEEVLARIRSCLRTVSRPPAREPALLTVNGLTLDPVSFTVQKDGSLIELTKKEFLILQMLMEHKNQVQTRKQLLKTVWNEEQGGDSNLVDVFISYLRNKLTEHGLPKFITTIRGLGYVIRED